MLEVRGYLEARIIGAEKDELIRSPTSDSVHEDVSTDRTDQVFELRDTRARGRKDLGQNAQGVGGVVSRETAVDNIEPPEDLWAIVSTPRDL